MNRALFTAAAGMAAQQAHLEVVANNLANAEVIGFKAGVAEFSEIAARGVNGLGSALSGLHAVFTPGKLVHGGGPFDLAIDGAGFFAVADAQGSVVLTRSGAFSRFADGSLRTPAGGRLSGIRIPEAAVKAWAGSDGRVWIERAGGAPACIGRIPIALVPSPEHLQSLGNAAWAPTRASGAVRYVQAGTHGAGALAFGLLERSNVSIIESMMEILSAQRAYEANAKGVQAADEMQRIANNLHRT